MVARIKPPRKRATIGRPYNEIPNSLVGASIARPHKNDVTFLCNGGSKPPPYDETSQIFLKGKGFPKGKTCAEFCEGKIQTGLPLGVVLL